MGVCAGGGVELIGEPPGRASAMLAGRGLPIGSDPMASKARTGRSRGVTPLFFTRLKFSAES